MATSVENVVLFGDSISAGFGLPSRRGWGEMLRQRFYAMNERNHHARFSDLSYVGDNSNRLVERIHAELPSRMREHRRHLSVVALGGQDIWEDLRANGLPDKYGHPTIQRTLSNTIEAARALKQYGMTLVIGPVACKTALAGLYGVDGMKNDANRRMSAALRQSGNALFEGFDIAAAPAPAEWSFTYVPLLAASATDPQFTLGRDGIHPDEQGHRWMFEQIVPYFDRLVQQPAQPRACVGIQAL